ncbi:DUF4385 family protein [Pedobacter sp. G11]|uniref:DUF4385 family protein n=1 Tax=Pedobacter sp. G11 TaxID=2482728 RepID=UPI000F5E6E6A|nr:DUF4385 family protein [Pedobacter sp. G11]AZI26559.1 DUF4385 family protein [Pedobacter sp. G11]
MSNHTEDKNHKKPSYLDFQISTYAWKPDIDYKKHPEQYKVGKGEQGVLICEPYKSEIGPLWRFKNPVIAQESAEKIFELFKGYLSKNDFVGADLARKYLQMGYTRARRYANYKGGKKYDKDKDYAPLDRGTGTDEKAAAAANFYGFWKRAEDFEDYQQRKLEWKKRLG